MQRKHKLLMAKQLPHLISVIDCEDISNVTSVESTHIFKLRVEQQRPVTFFIDRQYVFTFVNWYLSILSRLLFAKMRSAFGTFDPTSTWEGVSSFEIIIVC